MIASAPIQSPGIVRANPALYAVAKVGECASMADFRVTGPFYTSQELAVDAAVLEASDGNARIVIALHAEAKLIIASAK